ncbi:unnamed protein product [Lactuca virosa]|uniref:Uncharacterized protein n=1 Tax=Lactuca virosa TaxID=75947 RepID=A0AAU9N7G0_9ASTR|nr:unnamed protein product [Lactuca virosa]
MQVTYVGNLQIIEAFRNTLDVLASKGPLMEGNAMDRVVFFCFSLSEYKRIPSRPFALRLFTIYPMYNTFALK